MASLPVTLDDQDVKNISYAGGWTHSRTATGDIQGGTLSSTVDPSASVAITFDLKTSPGTSDVEISVFGFGSTGASNQTTMVSQYTVDDGLRLKMNVPLLVGSSQQQSKILLTYLLPLDGSAHQIIIYPSLNNSQTFFFDSVTITAATNRSSTSASIFPAAGTAISTVPPSPIFSSSSIPATGGSHVHSMGAIGAAVGAGIGTLIVVVCLFLLWRCRRFSRKAAWDSEESPDPFATEASPTIAAVETVPVSYNPYQQTTETLPSPSPDPLSSTTDFTTIPDVGERKEKGQSSGVLVHIRLPSDSSAAITIASGSGASNSQTTQIADDIEPGHRRLSSEVSEYPAPPPPYAP